MKKVKINLIPFVEKDFGEGLIRINKDGVYLFCLLKRKTKME